MNATLPNISWKSVLVGMLVGGVLVFAAFQLINSTQKSAMIQQGTLPANTASSTKKIHWRVPGNQAFFNIDAQVPMNWSVSGYDSSGTSRLEHESDGSWSTEVGTPVLSVSPNITLALSPTAPSNPGGQIDIYVFGKDTPHLSELYDPKRRAGDVTTTSLEKVGPYTAEVITCCHDDRNPSASYVKNLDKTYIIRFTDDPALGAVTFDVRTEGLTPQEVQEYEEVINSLRFSTQTSND
ncbi:MAG: hypothetical protein V4480_00400 [Patescibacteria group bacterium]